MFPFEVVINSTILRVNDHLKNSPILVRYKIYNLNFSIENQKLKIFDSNENILFKEKEIEIYKIFKMNPIIEKFYLLTNIGILIAYSSSSIKQPYFLTDLFLETSPGRLIFSKNFKQAIEIKSVEIETKIVS